MGEKNKKLIIFICIFVLGIFGFIFIGDKDLNDQTGNNSPTNLLKSTMEGSVISMNKEYISIQDKENIIYTFKNDNLNTKVGDTILLEYLGVLDKNKAIQDSTVINLTPVAKTDDETSSDLPDDGIFKDYYPLASKKLKTMSLSDKIGQLLLVRYPTTNAVEELKKYNFGGYIFFAKDFNNKTETDVKNMIKAVQDNTAIPLLTAVDEEGGTVVRVSSNKNLVAEPFKSSQELYKLGGFNKITEDTKEKSKVLKNLGLNLNLAPVVDVSTDPDDYMYKRSFGQNTSLTSTYAKTVIEASKNTGVSYTLKHFPGYGNNADTHTESSTDNRSLDDILNNDIPPFESGIQAGAEAVLVSHNIVTSIDANKPASLSSSVHNILRNRLNFTGVIITDDLDMGATSSIDQKYVEAILSGNDLLIVTDYETATKEIKKSLQDGDISEELIDKIVLQNLAWKYYKGLLVENEK